MADSTLSPNMSMPVPTVSEAPGPTWAELLNQCLSVIDSHTHGPGQGVPVTSTALLINSDLSFGSNNATELRSVRFTSQSAAISNPADIGCLYEVSADLYYNDGNGNQIRITQSGSVAGSTGTITGLPSGTASAAYSGGTFTFRGATSTPASMNVGPVAIGNATLNSKQITIYPNGSIASNFDMILPAALPASTNYVTLDASGQVSYNTSGTTGSGAVVLGTSPAISAPTLSGNVPAFQTVAVSTYPAGNTSSTSAKVGGVLYIGPTTSANSGTSETILYTYTLPANSLLTNDSIDIAYQYIITNNANTKTLKVYFGGQVVMQASATTQTSMQGICTVRRTAANLQVFSNIVGSSSNTIVPTEMAGTIPVTDSSPIVIKITGQSSAASNDVTCYLYRIIYYPGS